MRRLLVLFFAIALVFPAEAVEMGGDGLHEPGWLRVASKDLSQDFSEARQEGKLLLILIEQRGCIYCEYMHERVFTDERIRILLEDRFFPIQINLNGNGKVIDTDGEVLSERHAIRKWGAYSTPTIMLLPPTLEAGRSISDQTIAIMRGAFPVEITLTLFSDLLSWVDEQGHLDTSKEDFPAYYKRMMEKRQKALSN